MTKREIANIAKRMDEETRLLIDKEVEERLEILKEGELTEEELKEMEDCLYASLVIQEFLNGEYDLLEEERQELFDHMEEMYNKYGDLLVRARIEEKVGKKKRMALELMKIRERLMKNSEDYKNIKNQMKENRENYNKLNDKTKKSELKNLAKRNREGQKDAKLGLGVDLSKRNNNQSQTPVAERLRDVNSILNDLRFRGYHRHPRHGYDESRQAQDLAGVGTTTGSLNATEESRTQTEETRRKPNEFSKRSRMSSVLGGK